MATVLLFRDDAYALTATATVVGLSQHGIILDQTIFYAMGGGQPGDVGTLTLSDGRTVAIVNAVWSDEAKTEIAHVVPPEGLLPAIGDTVELALDWVISRGLRARRVSIGFSSSQATGRRAPCGVRSN